MENELAELKNRIDNLAVDGRGRRNYTSGVRRDVIAYANRRAQAGGSQGAVSRELGIHQATLSEWTGKRAKRKTTTTKVRRVELKRAGTAKATQTVVYAAGGLRVEGLTVRQIAELVKALS